MYLIVVNGKCDLDVMEELKIVMIQVKFASQVNVDVMPHERENVMEVFGVQFAIMVVLKNRIR